MKFETFATYNVPTFAAAMACVFNLFTPRTGLDMVFKAGWTADNSDMWAVEDGPHEEFGNAHRWEVAMDGCGGYIVTGMVCFSPDSDI